MSPFSAPFFLGHLKRGLLLPKRVAALWEGTLWWCKGGTGKAEDAKLPGAGIGPKQRQENTRQKKGAYQISENGDKEQAAGQTISANYSQRKATIGSTRDARRAGRYVANQATMVSSSATVANTDGSQVFTP